MSVTPISQYMAQTASAVQNATASSSGMTGMGENDFMIMLIAQMKNQNPMEPMDNKDLMGQVTQLNSLNELQAISAQMRSLTKASQTSYAASLIGKQVKAQTGEMNRWKVLSQQWKSSMAIASLPLARTRHCFHQ